MKLRTKDTLRVSIIAPFETFYDGKAFSVSATNKIGPFDILPGHISFMSLLTKGEVKLNTPVGEKSFRLGRGILKVHDNVVVIFANV